MVPSAPFPTPQPGLGENNTPDLSNLDTNIHLIEGGAIILLVISLLALAASVLIVIALWRTFSKAGQPGWAAIIPIYNIVVLLRIARRSPVWTLLALIPLGFAVAVTANPIMPFTSPNLYALLVLCSVAAGLVVSITAGLGVAEAFGRSPIFGVFALGVFGFVGYPILGFGHASYGSTPPQPPSLSADPAFPSAGG